MSFNCRMCNQLVRLISLCVFPCLLFLSSVAGSQEAGSNTRSDTSGNQVSTPLIAASIVAVDGIISGGSMDSTSSAHQPHRPVDEGYFILLWVFGVISFCALTLYLSSLRRFR